MKKICTVCILVCSICLPLLTACKPKDREELHSSNAQSSVEEESSFIEPFIEENMVSEQNKVQENLEILEESLINDNGQTIAERFHVPEGFIRQKTEPGSFAFYLQNLPLKPAGSKVRYYDGREKLRDVYLAVVDFSLGERDLQQCADGVIRLRAEYLYEKERYDEISFHFVNGFFAEFSKWRAGNKISVNGNQVFWESAPGNNGSYESFQKYLDMVYAYASTLSLEKELIEKSFPDLDIGDVLIQGGSPGHCVIVVDLAVNEGTGEKIFMLAQSYMPAQDIQILKGSEEGSPWFVVGTEEIVDTPEWSFYTSDLKTWK